MYKKLYVLILVVILAFSCSKKEDFANITFLHINDTHSKHLAAIRTDKETGAVSTNGGSSQLAHLIKSIKETNINTMAIHGGDVVTGSVFSIIYEGLESSDILNMSGFDLAVLGNHEFDFGLERAYEILEIRKFPTITLNAYEKDTGKQIVPSTFVTNIAGKSILFIGVLTSDEVYADKDEEGQFIVNDEIDSLTELFKSDKSIETNDLLVLVSHSGFENDKEIATKFPNKFDIIIGGHTHTFLPEPVEINNTIILQLNSNIKELGKLDIKVDSDNNIDSYEYQYIPIVNVGMDEEVEKYVMDKKVLVDERMGSKIAMLSDTLDDSNLGRESTVLGNFISDIVYDEFSDRDIDFVFLNSGSVRSPLEKGIITLGTMYEIHPFDNMAVYFEAKGSVVRDILTMSAIDNYGSGGFVMLSKGIVVTVSDKKVVESVMINGEPIDDNKVYKMITSDWLFSGGDGYAMIKENAENTQYIGTDVRDLLMRTFESMEIIDVESLDSTNRWIF